MASLPPVAGAVGEAVLTINGPSIARAVLVSSVALEIGFVLLDYHVNFGRLTDSGALRRLTNIAREDGLASWFSATQTLLVGLTAWAFWVSAGARRADFMHRAGWMLVAILFTYMALDDGVQLHERLGTVYDELREPGQSRFPSFSWQPLFVPTFAVLGGGAAIFLWSELRTQWARSLVISAFLLFATAVGLDFLEGLERDHPWNLYTAAVSRYDMTEFTRVRFRQQPYDTLVHFSRSLEELVEMLATTCIWTAMLGHAGTLMQNLRLQAKPQA